MTVRRARSGRRHGNGRMRPRATCEILAASWRPPCYRRRRCRAVSPLYLLSSAWLPLRSCPPLKRRRSSQRQDDRQREIFHRSLSSHPEHEICLFALRSLRSSSSLRWLFRLLLISFHGCVSLRKWRGLEFSWESRTPSASRRDRCTGPVRGSRPPRPGRRCPSSGPPPCRCRPSRRCPRTRRCTACPCAHR